MTRDENVIADPDVKKKLALKGKCSECKVDFSLYTTSRSGWLNKDPFSVCLNCFKSGKNWNREKKTDGDKFESNAVMSFIASLDLSSAVAHVDAVTQGSARRDSVPLVLDHHIFTRDGWVRANTLKHPTLRLRMVTVQEDYIKFGFPFPKIAPKYIDVVADSGAQSCLCSRKQYLNSGFSMKDLIPVTHNMKAANSAQIYIEGAFLIRLSGKATNNKICEATVMVYVSVHAHSFFLSKEAMVQLGIITSSFPQIGSIDHNIVSTEPKNVVMCIEDASISGRAECGCPRRKPPPGPPKKLPFTCSPENVEHMKLWLLDRYKSSTFNQCPHQLLPNMDGPALKLHVEPGATPINLRTPAPVPLHWQEKVRECLERDVALGVLEPVPYDEPTRWCFRMISVENTMVAQDAQSIFRR